MKKQQELAESLSQLKTRPKKVHICNDEINSNPITSDRITIEENNETNNTCIGNYNDDIVISAFHEITNSHRPAMCTGTSQYDEFSTLESCYFTRYNTAELCPNVALGGIKSIQTQAVQKRHIQDKSFHRGSMNENLDPADGETLWDINKSAYLENLRDEFRYMPVVVFYNLVRLWKLQQQQESNSDKL